MKTNIYIASSIAVCFLLLIVVACNPSTDNSRPGGNVDRIPRAGGDVAKQNSQAEKTLNTVKAVNDASRNNSFQLSILHWNVESGGNDPDTIGKQLMELGEYDVYALSEVDRTKYQMYLFEDRWSLRYEGTLGKSGVYGGNRDDDRLMIIYDKKRFELLERAEMEETEGIRLNDGNHRSPLYVKLKERKSGQEFIVVVNHLARGDEELRQQQARGLREWARTKSEPIIAVGDYNFDWDFRTEKGNAAFDEFMKDGVWKWIKPDPQIDTHWSDDGEGNDLDPNSMRDFSFVAGAAKEWKAECRVIVRDGDFPDDEKTSDHRPVELTFFAN